ncbi:hypothetical protein C8Q74DRAFT_1220381 [Fomes fomentarius]|nr:hypothetical protein C8Q74DRAFT_1220381 [Fomes fomentarius]
MPSATASAPVDAELQLAAAAYLARGRLRASAAMSSPSPVFFGLLLLCPRGFWDQCSSRPVLASFNSTAKFYHEGQQPKLPPGTGVEYGREWSPIPVLNGLGDRTGIWARFVTSDLLGLGRCPPPAAAVCTNCTRIVVLWILINLP